MPRGKCIYCGGYSEVKYGSACEPCTEHGFEIGRDMSEELKAAARKAAQRWGKREPSVDDVMTQLTGRDDWDKLHSDLTIFIINCATGRDRNGYDRD